MTLHHVIGASASPALPPYPTSDGPMVSLNWDTANSGFSSAGVYWDITDEFNVYILRGDATGTGSNTTTGTLSLYKYNLQLKTLTKIITFAGNGYYILSLNASRFTYHPPNRMFLVNIACQYIVFSDYWNTYVLSMATGAVLGQYTPKLVDSVDGYFADNGTDFVIFRNYVKNVSFYSPDYQIVQFNPTTKVVTWGTPISLGYSTTSAMSTKMTILPIAPSSFALSTTTRKLIFVNSTATGGSSPNYAKADYVGLGIFDFHSLAFTNSLSSYGVGSANVGSSPAWGYTSWINAPFVYDDVLCSCDYQYNFNSVNITSVVSKPFQTGAGAADPGGLAQRTDKKYYAVFCLNGDVWFCRGNPIVNAWTKLGTITTFLGGETSSWFASYGRTALFTTSGLIVCGRSANTTTAAPIAFFPLANI